MQRSLAAPDAPTPQTGDRPVDLSDPAVLRAEVERLRWWHRIDLGRGIVTPGPDPTPRKLETIRMPEKLTGRTVLDVGAWDGFFSFEAERRDAARVLATDSHSWTGPGWGTKAGFELARRALGSKVEDRDIDVLDLSVDRVGVFDVVLLLGVLYHMVHPMQALERVAEVTGDLLILETATDLVHMRRPALAFYPAGQCKDDTTNWFGPNRAAVIGMLKAVGFRWVDVVYEDSGVRRFARAVKRGIVMGQQSFLANLQQGRLVVHARR